MTYCDTLCRCERIVGLFVYSGALCLCVRTVGLLATVITVVRRAESGAFSHTVITTIPEPHLKRVSLNLTLTAHVIELKGAWLIRGTPNRSE